MARRNYRKSSKKIQPSVLRLNFILTQDGATKNLNYIDLSQCASIVNRRFYRQGLNWAVSGFKVLSSTGTTGQVSIHKLPNTWVMSNSWEKGFRAWNEMNKNALAESPSVKPKFLDFKIFANQDHHKNGFVGNLLPHSAATAALPIQTAIAGEWESSKASIPVTTPAGVIDVGQTNQFEFIAVGQSYPGISAVTGFDALSLVEGYAASRALPNILDPNTPTDASDTGGGTPENWISAIFNDGTNQDKDVLDDMITENNLAPYPFEGDGVNIDTMYPGGANQMPSLEIHDQEFITATTIGGTTRLDGGNFPCGIIEVATLLEDKAVINLEVELVPGMHRGYLCEPMTEM